MKAVGFHSSYVIITIKISIKTPHSMTESDFFPIM